MYFFEKKHFKFLLSPWSIILGMSIGVMAGLYFKDAAIAYKAIGDIYISILKMCILPIMASAVFVSLSKLLQSKETSKYLNKIIVIFVISLFVVSFIGTIAGLVAIPLMGKDVEMQKAIGKIMLEKESSYGVNESNFNSVFREIDSRYEQREEKVEPSLLSFVMNLIPINIFSSLASGSTLQIVFFFIVLGVMMKFIADKSSIAITTIFEGVFEAFQLIIQFAMYFLPIGLCSLIAYQFSQIGFMVLSSLFKLVVLIYFSSFIIFLISTLIIWRYCKGSYFRQFSALKDAIMLALGTRSSYAALPSAISGLTEHLHLNKDRTGLTVSLGFTLCKYGKVMVFCIGAVFAAHLYEYPIGIQSVLIIVISSVLAGMAASGAPSVVSRSMIVMVLAPLGIPAGAIIVILLAIDPIVDPVITLISTYPNYAVTAMIASEEN